MAIRVALHHKTVYQYNKRISLGPQVVRLRPSIHARTPVYSYSLKVEPQEHYCNWQQDPHGNFLARLVFPEKAEQLAINVDVVFDLVVFNPFDFFLEDYAEEYPFIYERSLQKQLRPCLLKSRPGPLFQAFFERIDRSTQRTIDFLVQVNQAVHQCSRLYDSDEARYSIARANVKNCNG